MAHHRDEERPLAQPPPQWPGPLRPFLLSLMHENFIALSQMSICSSAAFRQTLFSSQNFIKASNSEWPQLAFQRLQQFAGPFRRMGILSPLGSWCLVPEQHKTSPWCQKIVLIVDENNEYNRARNIRALFDIFSGTNIKIWLDFQVLHTTFWSRASAKDAQESGDKI